MNLGFPEMIFIFVMALIIFGPKKMPEIGRQIGRALNEFKKASNEFKSQIESEISHLDVTNSLSDVAPAHANTGVVTYAAPAAQTQARASTEPAPATLASDVAPVPPAITPEPTSASASIPAPQAPDA